MKHHWQKLHIFPLTLNALQSKCTWRSISSRTWFGLTLILALQLSAWWSWQNWLCGWARWWNIPNLSQLNPARHLPVLDIHSFTKGVFQILYFREYPTFELQPCLTTQARCRPRDWHFYCPPRSLVKTLEGDILDPLPDIIGELSEVWTEAPGQICCLEWFTTCGRLTPHPPSPLS